MAQRILHRGIVKSVVGKQITVQIEQAPACSSCAAARVCRSSENGSRQIDVVCKDDAEYKVGEAVLLSGSNQMGLSAVFLAYCLPLLIMLAAILVVGHATDSEPLSALVALVCLAAYYMVLYLNRDRLSRKFTFTVKHIK